MMTFVAFSEMFQQEYIPISHNIKKTLSGEENNIDNFVTIQSSTGKPWVLAYHHGQWPPSKPMSPETSQNLLWNDPKNMIKSSWGQHGLQIPQIPIWLNIHAIQENEYNPWRPSLATLRNQRTQHQRSCERQYKTPTEVLWLGLDGSEPSWIHDGAFNGSDFFWDVPQMLRQFGSWKCGGQGAALSLSSRFSSHSRVTFCMVSCIVLPCGATAIRECCCL